MVKKVLRKLSFLLMAVPRKIYYAQKKKQLINPNPSIISNNCIGGVIYHNLGLPFFSPTINLMFSNEEYLTFVQDLEGFMQAELVEINDPTRPYPVGQLTSNGKTITLYFVHYKTFSSAKEKWDSRKQRIAYSNLYFIFQSANITEEDIAAFEALPFENKMLITKNNPKNNPHIYVHDILSKSTYRFGEILEYTSPFSLHRHIDDIDYVRFLNTNH